MRFSATFFRVAAVCALLSAITTFGVHLLPLLVPPPVTFEDQIALAVNPAYVFRLWWVLAHILLVLFSMWGFAGAKLPASAGPVGFGLFGFLLFSMAELVRTSLALNAVNAWRALYASGSDETARAMLRENLLSWPQVGNALFFLLILGFFLGNLCFGIATWRGRGLEKTVSVALLVWSAISLAGFASEYGGQAWLELPEWVAVTYQPAARTLVALWLWREGSRAAAPRGALLADPS